MNTTKIQQVEKTERLSAENCTTIRLRCVSCQSIEQRPYISFFQNYRPGARIRSMICQPCAQRSRLSHGSPVMFIAAAWKEIDA